MRNSEYYKKAYDEVHAPAALLGKVMNMKKERYISMVSRLNRMLPSIRRETCLSENLNCRMWKTLHMW